MASVLLIDGDAIVSSCGFVNETRSYVVEGDEGTIGEFQYIKEARAMAQSLGIDEEKVHKRRVPGPVANALHSFKMALYDLRDRFVGASCELYIGRPDSGKNFRYSIYPDYKGHRNADDKPLLHKEIVEYAASVHGARLVDTVEVDDMLSIRANTLAARGEEYVIAGVDKDLLQIEGYHYRLHKQTLHNVDKISALRSFYTQVLTGDSADNIPGLPGVGPKTAAKIIEACVPEAKDLYEVCLGHYLSRGLSEEEMNRNCALLYLLKHEEDEWKRP